MLRGCACCVDAHVLFSYALTPLVRLNCNSMVDVYLAVTMHIQVNRKFSLAMRKSVIHSSCSDKIFLKLLDHIWEKACLSHVHWL